MTFLIYKASLLTDLSRFAYGQNQGPRKANLAKSVKIIKGSHLLPGSYRYNPFYKSLPKYRCNVFVLLSYKVIKCTVRTYIFV